MDYGGAILANTLFFKEEERCDQRVMPNGGGVSSTPFFFFPGFLSAPALPVEVIEQSWGRK